MTEDDSTEEERREAEALARALERGHGANADDDALQAAALIRYSRDGGALEVDSKREIRADLIAHAGKQGRSTPKPRLSFLRWLLPTGAIAAAATAMMVVLVNQSSDHAAPAATLPSPSLSLLQAQSAMARDTTETSAAEFETRMQSYRNQVFAALEARYAQ